jgi:hypothetical protein
VCNRGAFVPARFLDLIWYEVYDPRYESSYGAMMKNLQFTLAAMLLALPLASEAQQSLVDVARAEEARRKTVTKPAKVYTNESLKQDITAPLPANATPAAPKSAAPAPAAPDTQVPSLNLPGGQSEPPPPAKDQAYWSARIKAAREALSRSQIFAEALQSRINALTTDFVNRDDPAQRSQIELERQRSLAELERVKKEIAAHTKEIASIEEEARKAGVPPGWLR